MKAAQVGALVGAADGSVKGRRAVHGWISSLGQLEACIDGKGPVDGTIVTITSYRAELWGI